MSKIKKAIKETLVVKNKESIDIAVEKINTHVRGLLREVYIEGGKSGRNPMRDFDLDEFINKKI